MGQKYTRQSDNRVHGFERRRCPGCNCGQFHAVLGHDELRKCHTCGLVFNLELEGVLPSIGRPKSPRRKTTSSGSGVIAGRRLIRGYVF